MSLRAAKAVWTHTRQSGSALVVLLALADYANDALVAWPSVSTLAKMARINARSVHYALEALAKAGEIQAIGKGPRGVIKYRLIPALSLAPDCDGSAKDCPPSPQGLAEAGLQGLADNPPSTRQGTGESGRADDELACVQIIAAFDDAIVEVWGRERRRRSPAATDRATAQRWLAAGFTVADARDMVRPAMAKLAKKNRGPPRSLEYFSPGLPDLIAAKNQIIEGGHGPKFRSRAGRKPFDLDASRRRTLEAFPDLVDAGRATA
jgi:hypothetical protein